MSKNGDQEAWQFPNHCRIVCDTFKVFAHQHDTWDTGATAKTIIPRPQRNSSLASHQTETHGWKFYPCADISRWPWSKIDVLPTINIMAEAFMPLEELLLVAVPEHDDSRLIDILYYYKVVYVVCFISNVIYHFNIVCTTFFICRPNNIF